MENLRINVLRGVHTSDTLADLLEKLASADAVLLEAVGPEDINQRFQSLLNQLTHTANDHISAEDRKKIGTSYHGLVALGLVGTRKHIELVDRRYTDEDIAIGLQEKESPANIELVGVVKIFAIPSRRHKYAREILRVEAEQVRKRDTIVVEQTVNFISNSRQEIEAIIEEKGSYTIALVQGYAHRTAEALAAALPKAVVTQEIFGEEIAQKILHDDFTVKMLDKLVGDPHYVYTNKEIDYYTVSLFQPFLDLMQSAAPTFKSTDEVEMNVELMTTGLTHPVYANVQKSRTRLKSFDEYSDKEIAAAAKALLRRVRWQYIKTSLSSILPWRKQTPR